MSWDLRNSSVPVGDTDMYFVSFGNGKKNLILLPGLSDGLATVKGKARLLAKPYEMFFEKYTVYMFSRKNDMPDGYTIREMAEDQAAALESLSIEKTSNEKKQVKTRTTATTRAIRLLIVFISALFSFLFTCIYRSGISSGICRFDKSKKSP